LRGPSLSANTWAGGLAIRYAIHHAIVSAVRCKVLSYEDRTDRNPHAGNALHKPLVTATNDSTVARGLLVKAVTDAGVEGYGYSDLFPRTGETLETARHVIEAVLKPKGVGRELVESNRKQIEIFEAKINAKLDGIWGTGEDVDSENYAQDSQEGTQHIAACLV